MMQRTQLLRLSCRQATWRKPLVATKSIRFNSTVEQPDVKATTEKSFATTLITYNHPTAPLASFNKQLAAHLRKRGSPKTTLSKVLDVVGKIKQQNLKPDVNTYNALLAAYTRAKEHTSVMTVLQEMEANGIKPSLDSYNTVLEAFGHAGNVRLQATVVESMRNANVELTPTTYLHLIRGMCNAGQLEQALDTLDEIKELKMTPSLATYSELIRCCLQMADAQSAFGLLKEAEDLGLVMESQPTIYMDVMRAVARNDEHELVQYCWETGVETHNIRPDEGTCLDVLRVAAKSGNPKLATDVIRQLSKSGHSYKEHYFAPLLEAFVLKKDLKSAFNVLDIMRLSGITPTSNSTMAIQTHLGRNIKAIDEAYYILEELKKEGKNVDVTAFNTVVSACAEAGDLQRTIATYREAGNLGVVPDVNTYNAVLEACVRNKMKGMGNVVIGEMKKAEVMPDTTTYAKMVALACTQRNYEDAFTYLEEMKSYGVAPPASIYNVLVKKLAMEGDPRFHMALEEMETFGYPVNAKTRALWKQ